MLYNRQQSFTCLLGLKKKDEYAFSSVMPVPNHYKSKIFALALKWKNSWRTVCYGISVMKMSGIFYFRFLYLILQCDAIGVLEKEHDYKEEHFDFIQSHIRKFCLQCILLWVYLWGKQTTPCVICFYICAWAVINSFCLFKMFFP